MPNRMYETRLWDAGIELSISSVPANSMPPSGVEGMLEPSPVNLSIEAPGIRHLRELVACAVRGAVDPVEMSTFSAGDIAGSLTADQGFYSGLSSEHKELVDHALGTPILPVEQSWPQIASLGSVFAATGGGFAVGGPPGAFIGLVLTTVGTFAVTAAKAAAGTFGPRLGIALADKVIDEEGKYASAMEEIDRLEAQQKIDAVAAKELRKRAVEARFRLSQ
jgi:hypothetical protein